MGIKIAKDYNSCYPNDANEIEGIGQLTGKMIKVAGIFGGALTTSINDWKIVLDKRRIFLKPPYILETTVNIDYFKIWKESLTPLVSYGFSPSGKHLIIATSSEIEIFSR